MLGYIEYIRLNWSNYIAFTAKIKLNDFISYKQFAFSHVKYFNNYTILLYN